MGELANSSLLHRQILASHDAASCWGQSAASGSCRFVDSKTCLVLYWQSISRRGEKREEVVRDRLEKTTKGCVKPRQPRPFPLIPFQANRSRQSAAVTHKNTAFVLFFPCVLAWLRNAFQVKARRVISVTCANASRTTTSWSGQWLLSSSSPSHCFKTGSDVKSV